MSFLGFTAHLRFLSFLKTVLISIYFGSRQVIKRSYQVDLFIIPDSISSRQLDRTKIIGGYVSIFKMTRPKYTAKTHAYNLYKLKNNLSLLVYFVQVQPNLETCDFQCVYVNISSLLLQVLVNGLSKKYYDTKNIYVVFIIYVIYIVSVGVKHKHTYVYNQK